MAGCGSACEVVSWPPAASIFPHGRNFRVSTFTGGFNEPYKFYQLAPFPLSPVNAIQSAGEQRHSLRYSLICLRIKFYAFLDHQKDGEPSVSIVNARSS